MCDCLGKLQTVNLKWNTSIRSVAKDTEKMIGSSLRDASWLLLSGFIFSDQTKSFVLLLCLVWSCAMLTFQPWPSSKSFKRFIRHVVFSSLQHLFFYRRNVCLLYRYFDGEMSRWNLLFTFIARKRHAKSMRSNHMHFLRIPFVMRKFHLDSLSRELHMCRADSRLYMLLWTLQSQPLQVGFNHYHFLSLF